MLLDLREFEGRKAILAAIDDGQQLRDGPLFRVFSHLNYLFYGRAQTAPNIWIAGALTRRGVSVTGSGQTLEEAFLRIAGETAEAFMRNVDAASASEPLSHGYGSHTVAAYAARHAWCELIERICVVNWWRGMRRGELWDQERTARALDECSQSQRLSDREVRFVDVTMWLKTAVIIALSFDRSGYGFCFGAACSKNKQLAAHSAANELVQAEFGLQIALMKHKRFGAKNLSKKDRLNLLHARKLDRDQILSGEFIAQPIDTEGEDRRIAVPQLNLSDLGMFEGKFHVVEATAPHKSALYHQMLERPFADVPLY